VGTGSREETRQNKKLEPGSDSIRTDQALVGQGEGRECCSVMQHAATVWYESGNVGAVAL
jgi:hypothetical protein